MGEIKKSVGKDEGKGSLLRRWNAWEDNIKRYFKEIGYKLWTGFVKLRVGTTE
jgi:hypothetical protein